MLSGRRRPKRCTERNRKRGRRHCKVGIPHEAVRKKPDSQGDESGFFGGNDVERRDERVAARGCVFRVGEERPRPIAGWRAARGGSVELCEVGDEQQGGEGVEVEGAVVTEGEDDDGGAIEGGEGGEGGVEHSGEVD